MSWDVIIMRTDGVTDPQQFHDGGQTIPLGDAERVREWIAAFIPDLRWANLEFGGSLRDDLTVRFVFDESLDVDVIFIRAYGYNDVFSTTVAMCRQYGWQALDCLELKFIDLDHPSDIGWNDLDDFLDWCNELKSETDQTDDQ